MTIFDAILAVLGGTWAFLSAPLAVAIYGTLLALLAFFAFIIAGPASNETHFYDGMRWYHAAGAWAMILAAALFAAALIVWAVSSASPFEWMAP